MDKYAEYDNVYDLTEYRLHMLMERYATHGREDIATAISTVLEQYLDGTITIEFDGDAMYVQPIENKEDNA